MSAGFAETCSRDFARHETFAPRFGWLRKAYDAVNDPDGGPEIFLRPDAPVVLGVGKNMVTAIRYWSQAFKLTVEYPKGGGSRGQLAGSTYEAYWLFDDRDGADPWLEDPGSLWLLHWRLLARTCSAPAWWAAFHATPGNRLAEQDLVRSLRTQVQLAGWDAVADASFEKDADVIAKMYAPRRATAGSPGSAEDVLDCPFRDLGLLAAGDLPRTWSFTTGSRPTLPPAVVLFACLDYAESEYGTEAVRNGGSISLTRLAGAPGSPGRAFRLDEPSLADLLERSCAASTGASMNESAGQRALLFDRPPDTLASAALDRHYRRGASAPMSRTEYYRQRPEVARAAWPQQPPAAPAAADTPRRARARSAVKAHA